MSRGQREQLVPEADPENGDAADQLADDGDLVDERLGIAGTVGEQHPVEVTELVGRHVVRKHRDGGTRAREPAQDRALAAVVDHRDPR